MAVLDASPDGFAAVDADFRLIHVNQAYAAHYGRDPATVIGTLLADILGREVFDAWVRDRLTAAFAGESQVYERQMTNAAGDTLWLHMSYYPIRDAAGAVIAVAATQRDITQRKADFEASRQTTEMFRQAKNLANIGHWMWDEVNDRCLDCSDETLRIRDVSREEYMSHTSAQESDLAWYHPDDRDLISEAYTNCIENGERYDIRMRILHSDGTTRWLHEVGEPYEVHDGRTVKTIGSLRDITDEVEEREQRIIWEKLARQAEELAGIGHWMWDDANDQCVYCAENIAAAHGVTTQQFMEMVSSTEGDIARIYPEDRAYVSEAYARSRAGGIYNIEYRINHPDGGLHWIHEFGGTGRVQSGSALLGMGTMQDITARKLEEEKLHRAGELAHQAERMAGIGHWLWDDANDMCLDCSEEVARIYGVTCEEFIGEFTKSRDDLKVIHSDDIKIVSAAHQAFVDHAEPYDIEFRIITPDGDRWLQEICEPYEMRDGRVAKSIGTIRDITVRKSRELALEVERERVLQASKAKSEFLAHMSHELRTPLNAVLGFSDAMRAEVFGPIGNDQYKEYLGYIQNSGKLLLALINDLLDMSAIEAGALNIETTPLALAPLVAEMADLASFSASAKNINVEIDMSGLRGDADVDPRRFRQVVLNLLTNAVKFTPEGGNVEILGSLEASGCPLIIVRDDGIGMNEQECEAALVPFKQIKDARVRHVEGTGIGLPLSKKLVELHGGILNIESEKGVGTVVRIMLPAKSYTELYFPE